MTILLTVLSGIFYIIIFPKFDFSFLAWICLIPLFWTIFPSPLPSPPRGEGGVRGASFGFGFLAGLIANLGILYWIVPTCLAAQQTLILSLGCLLLLSSYLALYWGIFAFGCSYFFRRQSYFFVCLAPALFWVILEYLRTYLLTGFPWALLGYSQWQNLPIIQIAEYTGVYGVSFLVVLVNTTIFWLINYTGKGIGEGKEKPQTQKNFWLFHNWVSLILPAVIFFLSFLIYHSRKEYFNSAIPNPKSAIKIALLQGNIDQYKKWNSAYEREIIQAYTQLAHLASQSQPVLIIWPETAVPGYLVYEPKIFNWIVKLVAETQTDHLIGSIHQRGIRNYNSAFLINPEGKIVAEYDKIHLVPFGEYVPLQRFLSRYITVLNELGNFYGEKNYQPMSSPIGKLAINICFEAIFPNLVRRLVNNGGEVIVNLTNDAWFLKTAAPYQHFVINVFRAIENRRPVLRADNTGISGYIDSLGRIRNQTNIFETTFLIVDFSGEHRYSKTFYTRYGDIFAWGCIVVLLGAIIRNILRF